VALSGVAIEPLSKDDRCGPLSRRCEVKLRLDVHTDTISERPISLKPVGTVVDVKWEQQTQTRLRWPLAQMCRKIQARRTGGPTLASVRKNMPNKPTQPEPETLGEEDVRERARDEAEQVRRRAEETRQARDQHREGLEMARQERERLREAGETARVAGEDARVAAETARHAAIGAVNATAQSLQITLEQMHAVEEMRRTLRDGRDTE
jgi:hypothetical protein